MSVMASHCSTTHRGCALAHEVADLLAEDAGVGEEQRRLPAVHDDAWDLPGVGMRADAVPARRALEPAQDGAVGPPVAPEEQQDRQGDGDDDALQDAEQHHPERGDERHREGAGTHAEVAAQRAKSMSDRAATITTAASAVCGRSASSEFRNSRSTTTSPAPTTPVSLALGARLLGHRGT